MTDNRTTELLDGLRNVGNLHEFAELFGFDWTDESDWDWHDVACAMADAMAGDRSCASCHEADNPDSYINHLQSALKWHDEHVPRPTNPRNTCVVLKGERPPEEVLFVREDGKVTHYQQEGTCDGSFHKSSDLSSGRVPLYYCKDTNRSIFVEREAKVCPLCGRRIKEESE